MSPRGRVAALALLVALTGCADSGAGGAAPSPSGTTTTAPASATPTPSASCTPAFTATTGADTGTASGAALGMKAARGAAQAGYDRVVFELAGAGQPGWDVQYVGAAESDGSGEPVTVSGTWFLRVIVRPVGLPGDTGVPEPTPTRFTPRGTAVVREVALDHVFEGQYTAFIGLSSKKPFRVTRLAGPPRVVVDVRHC